MKKVLFLMVLLLLMGLGAASVKAQVRIGGNTPPSAAAVLDLNATDATNNGTGGFTLPRVSLASNTAQLNNTTPITGMLVYNTNATLGVGVYFWNGVQWVLAAGSIQFVTWTLVKDTTFVLPNVGAVGSSNRSKGVSCASTLAIIAR